MPASVIHALADHERHHLSRGGSHRDAHAISRVPGDRVADEAEDSNRSKQHAKRREARAATSSATVRAKSPNCASAVDVDGIVPPGNASLMAAWTPAATASGSPLVLPSKSARLVGDGMHGPRT
jgi:hypothetical protein